MLVGQQQRPIEEIIADGSTQVTSPFRLEIHRAGGFRSTSTDIAKIVVRPFQSKSRGPYPENTIPRNSIRFTATQVKAIRQGCQNGLTLVCGPPGSGKTDVAVQIISNLYHNHPNQKILVVTHSNAALNDIFEKIMVRDIHPRHLIRLGSGESDLRESLMTGIRSGKEQYESIFSRQGRVDYCLMKRFQLLAQVQRLSQSLGLAGDVGSSCETAGYFYERQVKTRLEKYLKAKATQGVKDSFPFTSYFADVARPLFTGDESADESRADSCLNYLVSVFDELKDYRPLELLRTQSLRGDYLITRQVRFEYCILSVVVKR